ncbi:uracil permease [Salmonella enterica subsp. enterica]|uniref:Uracil permease n=1 Tax=Salmonella enterica I TaxID=59201 RepID=A0A379WPI6_SALET|nr:uracil permease [Salmonella enterica subsp. enterica]
MLAGYALSFALRVVDTTPIAQAHWFALPTFYTPRFEWFAILTILPAALVVIAEHVGHLVVTANIVQKGFSARSPVLHRSMFANGLSTIVSGFFGSTPNTTYGENIGVMAITPRLQYLGYRRRGDFRHSAFLRWQTGGGDSDYPVTRDGRRLAAVVRRYRRVGDSRLDRIKSRLQQSAKP